eukprot:5167263-Amphidinium_carterae.1
MGSIFTIKLRDAPGFMKREEESFFDRRDLVDMEPVKRSSQAWNMFSMDDNMGVKSNKPTRPPPADANPGFWNSAGEWIEDDYVATPRPPPPGAKRGRWNSDGEWVEGGSKTKPPPPALPLPPTNHKEREAFQVMTNEDHQDYSKLVSLENLKEEDPIRDWALQMGAPRSPVVFNPETSFAESAPLKVHEAFDGHATLKKGTPCFLC